MTDCITDPNWKCFLLFYSIRSWIRKWTCQNLFKLNSFDTFAGVFFPTSWGCYGDKYSLHEEQPLNKSTTGVWSFWATVVGVCPELVGCRFNPPLFCSCVLGQDTLPALSATGCLPPSSCECGGKWLHVEWNALGYSALDKALCKCRPFAISLMSDFLLKRQWIWNTVIFFFYFHFILF